MSELPFFKILHNETKPSLNIGRGAHYSVMRVPIWQDKWLRPMRQGAMLDFAIIWDEDHDERILDAIEILYFRGLLAPVMFIGERKGTLSVLIDVETVKAWTPARRRKYQKSVGKVSCCECDSWPANVSPFSRPAGLPPRDFLIPSIIHDDHATVCAFLKNIDSLWQIGIKPYDPPIPF